MGVKSIALTVILIAGVCVAADEVGAIALGELQAVAGSNPPHVFRLAILPAPGSTDIPAVTVRQPQDALSLVKNNTLELRLRSFSDVELEINQDGQTLNRLLLKSELQAARARADAASAWDRYRAAKAKSVPRPQLTALLEAAYQAHRDWGQLDPAASQPLLARVEQERVRFLAAGARGLDPVTRALPTRETPLPEAQSPRLDTAGTPDGAALAREMQELREGIQNLTARVTPWAGAEARPRHPQGREDTAVSPLLLVGVFVAGVTSLFTGYMTRRWASDHERRRVLIAALRRARAELISGPPTLPAGQRGQLSEGRPSPPEPAAVVRHLHLSWKTRRRVRVHTSRENPGLTPLRAAGPTQTVARLPHTRVSTRPELLEALVNLRQDLLNL